jgi:hypothetical protein
MNDRYVFRGGSAGHWKSEICYIFRTSYRSLDKLTVLSPAAWISLPFVIAPPLSWSFRADWVLFGAGESVLFFDEAV